MSEGLRGNIDNFLDSASEGQTEEQKFENDIGEAKSILSESSEWKFAKRNEENDRWIENQRKELNKAQMEKFGELVQDGIIEEEDILNLGDSTNKDQVRSFVEMLRSQQRFESKTKMGFDRIAEMNNNDLSDIIDGFNSAYHIDRGFGVALTKMLAGQALEEDPRNESQMNNSYLVGLNVLEIGGPSLIDDSYGLGNKLLNKGANYTSIDLDKGISPEYVEGKGTTLQEVFDNNTKKSTTFQAYKLNVLDLDEKFPDAQWDCVCGVRFFGYPTNRGKDYELSILESLSHHLREGGVMWFANIESSSLEKEDFEKYGLEFTEKHHEFLPFIWILRKKSSDNIQETE